jgi:hypothetical protein
MFQDRPMVAPAWASGADPVCVRRGFAQGCADRAVRAERLEQEAKL